MVYMVANNKMTEEEQTKIATFLWLVGEQGVNIYNTLFPNDGSEESLLGTRTRVLQSGDDNTGAATIIQRKLQEVIDKFDEHCLPQKNVAMESYIFNMIAQKENQPFKDFETELRTQLRKCEFKCDCGKSYEDRLLRDRIIIGVFDKKLQLKLLDARNEPLSKVIEICRVYETANAHKNILDAKSVASVDICQEEAASVNAVNKFCFNCGENWNMQHAAVCRARNIICRGCSKKGHFQRMCRKHKGRQMESNKNNNNNSNYNNNDRSRNVQGVRTINWCDVSGNSINVNNVPLDSDPLFIHRVNSNRKGCWVKKLRVGSEIVTFKIDTGAEVNCLPLKYIKKEMQEFVVNKRSEFVVCDYSNNKIETFGTITLGCRDSGTGREKPIKFIVVDNKFEPILGLDTSVEFGLIKRLDIHSLEGCGTKEHFLSQNKELFKGLGQFPGTFKIYLHEHSRPVLHYKKRIPLSLMEKLKVELDSMIKEGIISPVSYPTDWVNNVQVVEKPNGKLRVCLDPKPLNACIKREHFLIPTIDNLTSKLVGKTMFSVLDLSSGFWHMLLDKESSDLTTFMTPFGRYKFNRVPFGLCCSPEMFQRKMIEMLGDLEGVMIYFDDLLIYANNEGEHDKILKEVIKRARKYNIKFNKEKMQYRQEEVKFMGHIISKDKIKPKKKYQELMMNIKKPADKKAVLRFLGIAKYIGRFIPNLSKLTVGLRELTKHEVQFVWTKSHDEEFEKLVKIISSEPVLAIYDPSKPVIVQTDASKDGLGCVILQNGHPVAFASRTLSKNEQKWAQIEKELLAVVFACQRFHFFLYGRDFTVQSDHKPLESLIKRDIDDVTARLQRMFMSLLKYSGMTLIYKPGKEMIFADCLSRAQMPEVEESEELACVIHSVTKAVCFSQANYELYKKCMSQDEELSRICEYVKNAWPSYHQLNAMCQQFFKLKSELHFENELLFYNHRLVIPRLLQNKIAKWIHESHLGIEKTLARARKLYFWPGMNEQIKTLVKSCKVCEKFTRNNQKEPLIQEDTPKYPYQVVAMDLFEYAGRDFIAMIDAYSNFLVAMPLANKTTKTIITSIQSVFNKVGYPTIIKCDNSPFGSAEFKMFASTYNIRLVFSSPRYPQSNGLAEKAVAIAKNILKRCYEVNEVEQFQYRVLEYNVTPVATLGVAPVELFLGRLVKSMLPLSESLLCRNIITESDIQKKIVDKKKQQKFYYDRGAKSLPKVEIGDKVIFRKNDREWNHGTIVKNVNNRSFIVRDNFDNNFRRNRRFIVQSYNNDFQATELLSEENVGKYDTSPNKMGRKNNNNNDNNNDVNISINTDVSSHVSNECAVVESEGSESRADTSVESSDAYLSATSHDSEIEDYPLPSKFKTTRSGRVVRPPKKYGFD